MGYGSWDNKLLRSSLVNSLHSPARHSHVRHSHSIVRVLEEHNGKEDEGGCF